MRVISALRNLIVGMLCSMLYLSTDIGLAHEQQAAQARISPPVFAIPAALPPKSRVIGITIAPGLSVGSGPHWWAIWYYAIYPGTMEHAVAFYRKEYQQYKTIWQFSTDLRNMAGQGSPLARCRVFTKGEDADSSLVVELDGRPWPELVDLFQLSKSERNQMLIVVIQDAPNLAELGLQNKLVVVPLQKGAAQSVKTLLKPAIKLVN